MILRRSNDLSSFQIGYPDIDHLTKPRHRFLSSYEQVDSKFIDLLFYHLLSMWLCFNISVFLCLCYDGYGGCNHLTKDISIFCLHVNCMKLLLSRCFTCEFEYLIQKANTRDFSTFTNWDTI